MYTEKAKRISQVIDNYLQGVFHGDLTKLKASFDKRAHLFGDVRGNEYQKSLEEYLEGVKSRQSPAQLNEEYRMKILGIEILGNVALARVHLPMLGYNYYDFLSLSCINGEWKIVSKTFAHVE